MSTSATSTPLKIYCPTIYGISWLMYELQQWRSLLNHIHSWCTWAESYLCYMVKGKNMAPGIKWMQYQEAESSSDWNFNIYITGIELLILL
jgi:hypothetical protein